MRSPALKLYGFPSLTLSLTCTDEPQYLPEDELTRDINLPLHKTHAILAIITCEIGNVRWTVGYGEPPSVVPARGHILVANSLPVILEGNELLSSFRFLNATTDPQEYSILHVSIFFERSVELPRAAEAPITPPGP